MKAYVQICYATVILVFLAGEYCQGRFSAFNSFTILKRKQLLIGRGIFFSFEEDMAAYAKWVMYVNLHKIFSLFEVRT